MLSFSPSVNAPPREPNDQAPTIDQPNLYQVSPSFNSIVRALHILSIGNLRDFLREYSLPTGGNKRELVQRLIYFLETFSQTQPQLLVQFQVRLQTHVYIREKKPDSESDAVVINASLVPVPEASPPILDPAVKKELYEKSPSVLFETFCEEPACGPHMVQPHHIPTAPFTLNLTDQPCNSVAVIQFVPIFPENPISRISFQVGQSNQIVTLTEPNFYYPLNESKICQLTIHTIEPKVPICFFVRWLRKVPLREIVASISKDWPTAPPHPIDTDKATLICPLTRKLMQKPARGVNCQHGECFDLSGYLCFAAKTGSWVCPCCSYPLTADDLRVDPSYIHAVLSAKALQK